MPDPFEALRSPPARSQPDPDFATRLRAQSSGPCHSRKESSCPRPPCRTCGDRAAPRTGGADAAGD